MELVLDHWCAVERLPEMLAIQAVVVANDNRVLGVAVQLVEPFLKGLERGVTVYAGFLTRVTN